jgi:uncharacterized protein (DUF427 family)
MKAIWNGTVVAESDDIVTLEGNHYFPRDSLKSEFTTFSNHRTSCVWKGQAYYLSLFVKGEMNPDAVWFYPEPTESAQEIKGRVAFKAGVDIVD